MPSAQELKILAALQVKKYRQKYRMFLLEGTKLVEELLAQQRVRAQAVYGTTAWAKAHAALVARAGALFRPIGEGELRKISSLTTPPGVLATANLPAFQPLEGGLTFYLDGIRDPGNLGTILRIADWFGFSAVYCSPDCADAFSPKVVQASMGAILHVPVAELPLADLLLSWGERPVVGAVLDGTNAFQASLPTEALLVVGSESEGIRPEIARHLTHRLTLPRTPGSRAESLNAAVAAGILAALFRQKSST